MNRIIYHMQSIEWPYYSIVVDRNWDSAVDQAKERRGHRWEQRGRSRGITRIPYYHLAQIWIQSA